MDIQMFHLYNRLVRRKMAAELTCSCGTPFVLRDKDGEPVLECFSCQSVVVPGLALYDSIVSVVKQHFKV